MTTGTMALPESNVSADGTIQCVDATHKRPANYRADVSTDEIVAAYRAGDSSETKWVARYKAGESCAEIAASTAFHINTVRRHIKGAGALRPYSRGTTTRSSRPRGASAKWPR